MSNEPKTAEAVAAPALQAARPVWEKPEFRRCAIADAENLLIGPGSDGILCGS